MSVGITDVSITFLLQMKMNAVLVHSVMNSQVARILLQITRVHAMMDILPTEQTVTVYL